MFIYIIHCYIKLLIILVHQIIINTLINIILFYLTVMRLIKLILFLYFSFE